MKEFKVGQVWRTRGGETRQVLKITNNQYPIETEAHSYTVDGYEYIGAETSEDLIELAGGERYNIGKPPFDLVPLMLIGNSYLPSQMRIALSLLGCWQARDEGCLPEMFHLLGKDGWSECAQVFDYGRNKYSAWNWTKGMAWSIPLACAARHLIAMLNGEENDPESGLPHRGHVFCNIVMLLTYASTFPEGDDRAPLGSLCSV